MSEKTKARRMPKFTPAPEAVVALFEVVMEGLPEVERRRMFGYPCAFQRGQMFAGVFQDRLFLRLSEADRAKCLKLPGVQPFEPLPGRAMREYVEFAPETLGTPAAIRRWARRGLAYVETLPPKVKKPRRTQTPKVEP